MSAPYSIESSWYISIYNRSTEDTVIDHMDIEWFNSSRLTKVTFRGSPIWVPEGDPVYSPQVLTFYDISPRSRTIPAGELGGSLLQFIFTDTYFDVYHLKVYLTTAGCYVDYWK
jgi:hypothetical protein